MISEQKKEAAVMKKRSKRLPENSSLERVRKMVVKASKGIE
jgi:hypothetical protein